MRYSHHILPLTLTANQKIIPVNNPLQVDKIMFLPFQLINHVTVIIYVMQREA